MIVALLVIQSVMLLVLLAQHAVLAEMRDALHQLARSREGGRL